MSFAICIPCFNIVDQPMLVHRHSKAKCRICGGHQQGLIVSYVESHLCNNEVGCDHITIEYKCGLYPFKNCPVPNKTLAIGD